MSEKQFREFELNREGSYKCDLSFLDEAISCYIKSETNSGDYLKALIFISFHIESLIKTSFVKINPALIFDKIDQDVVAFLYDLYPRRAYAVRNNPMKQMPNTARMGILLNRYFQIRPKQGKYRSYLESLFEMRNRIVHSDPIHKLYIDEQTLNICLYKAFEFVKLNSKISPQNLEWKRVEVINQDVGNKLRLAIAKKIQEARARNDKLTVPEKELHLNTPLNLPKDAWGPEVEHYLGLECPACGQLSMGMVLGPIIPWFNSEDGEEKRESYLKCRICKLTLKEVEYTEIAQNPQIYSLQKNWGNQISGFDDTNFVSTKRELRPVDMHVAEESILPNLDY